VGGILLARHWYVTKPEVPTRIADRFQGAYGLLFNKYYVDELYDATVIRGTTEGARGLFAFDRTVVDGAVDGSGVLTRLSAWVSHVLDKYVVDGAVNLLGWSAGEGSLFTRRLQTGLIQNYALLMVLGVFLFLTVYLIAR
jgi:NADH-quinone oxidoreductase subunit L